MLSMTMSCIRVHGILIIVWGPAVCRRECVLLCSWTPAATQMFASWNVMGLYGSSMLSMTTMSIHKCRNRTAMCPATSRPVQLDPGFTLPRVSKPSFAASLAIHAAWRFDCPWSISSDSGSSLRRLIPESMAWFRGLQPVLNDLSSPVRGGCFTPVLYDRNGHEV
jgi:hypothetical protein